MQRCKCNPRRSAVSIMPASWEVVCHWVPHPVLPITAGLSNTTTLQRHHHCPGKLHACRANNNIFYIFYFIFCSMYLVLFSIVLYRTIVTVYTDNIFLYNYLLQMHQIIHLSQVGCFTTARGKTVQKNRDVSWVNDRISVWKPRGHCFEFTVASKVFSYVIVIEKQRIYFYIYTAA